MRSLPFIVLSANDSAEGMIKMLMFFIFLMLVFWGINMYRHVKSEKWTNLQKIVDIAGIVFFAGLIISLLIPLIGNA